MGNRAEYMREYRKRHPESYERDLQLTRARDEALRRFAAKYPSLFAEVYDEVTAERGIPSVWEYESERGG